MGMRQTPCPPILARQIPLLRLRHSTAQKRLIRLRGLIRRIRNLLGYAWTSLGGG